MLPGFIATMRVLTSVHGRSSLVVHQFFRSSDPDAFSEARDLLFSPVTRILAYLPMTYVLAMDSSPCLSRLNFKPFRLQPPSCHFATIAFTSRYITVVARRVYPPGRLKGRWECRRAV